MLQIVRQKLPEGIFNLAGTGFFVLDHPNERGKHPVMSFNLHAYTVFSFIHLGVQCGKQKDGFAGRTRIEKWNYELRGSCTVPNLAKNSYNWAIGKQVASIMRSRNFVIPHAFITPPESVF